MQEQEANAELEPQEEPIEPEVIDEAQAAVPELQVEEIEAAAPPSKRLRRFLIWAVIVLFIFGLGVGASWVLQVKPQAEQIVSIQARLDSAESELASAQAELEVLRPLKAENVDLTAALQSSEQHLDLLFVLVDVSTAQLGMLQEDVLAAKAALNGTDARLANLEKQLSGSDAQTVAGLRDRVALVMEEADSDAFAARRDLEILANNLLSLERLLFAP